VVLLYYDIEFFSQAAVGSSYATFDCTGNVRLLAIWHVHVPLASSLALENGP